MSVPITSQVRRRIHGGVVEMGANVYEVPLIAPPHAFYEHVPYSNPHFDAGSFGQLESAFFPSNQSGYHQTPTTLPLATTAPLYLQNELLSQRQQQHEYRDSHGHPNYDYPQSGYVPWHNISPTMPGPYAEPPTLPTSQLATPAVSAGAIPRADNVEGESTPDGKLLDFLPSAPSIPVVDGLGRLTAVEISAELYGMFFVAEHVFADDDVDASAHQELTCYRRNLWQVTGEITVPRQITHVSPHGHPLPILELAVSIHATESIEGKPVEIITTPWKGVSGAGLSHSAAPPHQVTLDLKSAGGGGGAGREVDGGSRVCMPVTWKRLQFKHATANNGRRKGMQQCYHVHISLVARIPSGEWIPIVNVRSGPIVVRGRSPRNFDVRGEVPLGAASWSERRGGKKASMDNAPAPPSVVVDDEAVQTAVQRGNKRGAPSQDTREDVSIESPDAKRPRSRLSSPQRAPEVPRIVATTTALDLFDDALHGFGRDDASIGSYESNQPSPAADRGTPFSDKAPRTLPRSPSSENDDDCLYEYFPLSVDDWMTPVDAVYRPHFVHTARTGVGHALPIQGGQGRIKAYFVD